MNTIRLSATLARNNFFELLNKVATGTNVIIEKDNKEVALLSTRVQKTDWKGLFKASKKVHGIFKNAKTDDITTLRDQNSWQKFGKWDEKQ